MNFWRGQCAVVCSKPVTRLMLPSISKFGSRSSGWTPYEARLKITSADIPERAAVSSDLSKEDTSIERIPGAWGGGVGFLRLGRNKQRTSTFSARRRRTNAEPIKPVVPATNAERKVMNKSLSCKVRSDFL